MRPLCTWWHGHQLPVGSHRCSVAVIGGAQPPRPPQSAAPLPDSSLSLRCRGATLPTDTPSPRRQRQRIATGKHRCTVGVAPGGGGSCVSPPEPPHPSFCTPWDKDRARHDEGVLQTGTPVLPFGLVPAGTGAQAGRSRDVLGGSRAQQGKGGLGTGPQPWLLTPTAVFAPSYGRVYAAADPYHHTIGPAATYSIGTMVRAAPRPFCASQRELLPARGGGPGTAARGACGVRG